MGDPSIKILIVDDENLARQKIVRYLGELAHAGASFEIKEAANGLEAITALETFEPTVVFLDIQMPGLNGFEVLDHFAERPFAVIFQTAYDEFAIKAFEENACDYLLKPFTRERFAKSFERARQQNSSRDALLKTVTAEQRYLENLCVDDRGVRILIAASTVDALVSRDHYTCIHCGAKEYLIDLSLQKLEERLDPSLFIRAHRAALVRVAAIRSMSKGEEPEVELHSGLKVTVSRRCRGALIERLKGKKI